jgi:hypothetical protein
MTQVTLTTEELSNIIDQAFVLGKVYAADELSSAGYDTIPCQNAGGFLEQESFRLKWNQHIEERGGNTLNSGDAKLDLMLKYLAKHMRQELKQFIDY